MIPAQATAPLRALAWWRGDYKAWPNDFRVAVREVSPEAAGELSRRWAGEGKGRHL